jgi:hypothetical protein
MAHRQCLIAVCLCCVVIVSSGQASGRALALYSWKPPGKSWHFVLIRDPFPKNVSASDVIASASPLVGVDALKARLSVTPRTSWAIMWRDLPPDHIVRYPPFKVCDDIIAFGRQHGLNIEKWPTLNE